LAREEGEDVVMPETKEEEDDEETEDDDEDEDEKGADEGSTRFIASLTISRCSAHIHFTSENTPRPNSLE
jgi:hypothetical protein